MNTLFKISAAFATALVTLAACQKVNEIEETPALSHTVKFTSSALTKTSYAIEGTTVKYKWEESDLERIHVFEDGTEGTVVIEDSAIDEDYILLTVNFGGSGEGSHTYTANLNNGTVGSNQVAANDKYDSDCDVLVAKPVSSEEITDGIYTFQFRRPVAITELKLKGLKAGEEVSKVTILSDASSTLTGTYTQGTEDPTTGEWGNASNKIVVTFGAGETKTVESDGSLIVPIVSTPVEDASIKVLVETESGLKYRKKTSAALTLSENNVKVQGIVMTPVTEAEHANAGWYLVTNASELFDGDEIRIACTSENKMAGDFLVNEKGTQVYLEDCTVSFNEGKLTGVTPGKLPLTFTLSEGYLFWNILSPDGDILCAKDKDGMKYNDGVADWSISINEVGESTISSTNTEYGSIQYNKNNPRFRNYISSQTGIQIYKKYGNPVDPAIKTARIASFNPESATVTIDANNNVFPELSFDPTEATEGTRTWTSSNTDVATVDAATGELTLVSAGTTTISVEIAESDDYQPCEASYVLTVKSAPEAITPGTYSIATNNALWGTSYSGTATGCTTVSGCQNNISVTLNKADCSNAMYINDSQTRTYNGNTMVFSVPNGYVITSIGFTADGSNWSGTHEASTGEMTDNKNWVGQANPLTINFKGTCRMVSVSVTYEEGEVPATDATWSVSPASVSVEEGAYATATITTNYDGTLLVSSNNPGIATATISGKTITVTGVAEGTTTLTVTGAATTAFNAINETITVTVTANIPDNEDTYVLCTSTTDLVAGAKYIIASGTNGDIVCISNESNANNRKAVSATVSESKITVSETSKIMTMTLGGSAEAWTLFTDNYEETNGYLASASSGKNNYCRVIADETTCTITFSEGAAVINLNPHTERTLLRYNPNSGKPLFACYTSGQNEIYLYKKSN